MMRPQVQRQVRQRVVALSVVALCVATVLGSGAALAQTAKPAGKPFQPTVNQPGKDVVWVPTSQALVDRMLDMAKVTASDVVIDLGSGDGITVISAARRGARAQGIEYNPDMVQLSRRRAAMAGVADRATFTRADLLDTDFSHATVVTMFLLPSLNMQLRPKLLGLRPGTRVVSNTWDMEDWTPDEVTQADSACVSWCKALLWIVPANVEGTWKAPQGELVLTQQFQRLGGTLGGERITSGTVRGEQLTFTVGAVTFEGRVTGTTIAGQAGNVGWTATR